MAHTDKSQDDLWRDFPKTALEFETRFATEADCRAYWIEARWGGDTGLRALQQHAGLAASAAAPCSSAPTAAIRPASHRARCCRARRKPFKTWFRAVFEISSRRNGISAKDLQRIMGFGSYETAWTWLHKLRAALVLPEREAAGPRRSNR